MTDMKRLYLASFARSGSRWTIALLGRYFGTKHQYNAPASRGGSVPPERCAMVMGMHKFASHDPSDLPFISRGNLYLAYKSLWESEKLIVIVRDPRNVLMSMYYLWYRFDSYKAHQRFGLDKECKLIDFLERVFPHRFAPGHGWREFCEGWLEADPRPPFIFHDALMVNREKELRRALTALGVEINDEWIERAIRGQMNEGRAPFVKTPGFWLGPQTTPKGDPGEWKRHFTTDVAKAMHDYCGDLMYEFGFITDSDWWKGWETNDERMASGVAVVCDAQENRDCAVHDSEPEKVSGLS